MGAAKNKLIAVIIFLFSIITTYIAQDLILALPNFLTNTLQTMIFWTGLIFLWVMITIITPFYLSMVSHDIKIIGIPKAIGIYITTIMVMIISWYIIPDITTAITNAGGFSLTNTMLGIVWLGAISLFILGAIIAPTYCIAEALQIDWNKLLGKNG